MISNDLFYTDKLASFCKRKSNKNKAPSPILRIKKPD